MLPFGDTERLARVGVTLCPGEAGVTGVRGAGEAGARRPEGGRLPPLDALQLPISLPGEEGDGRSNGSCVSRVRRENTPRRDSHWK